MAGLRSRDHRCGGSDTGDIVLGWLTKVVVGLSLAGIVAFDGISVATARLAVEDQAAAAALSASEAYRRAGDVQAAYDAAVADATEADPLNQVVPTSFRAEPDGTVTLDVRRTASTLVLRHVGWVDHWADVTGHGAGRDI